MKILLTLVFLLLFSLPVMAQDRVALVVGPTPREAIFLDSGHAQRMYKRLHRKHRRTPNEERLYAALVISLGTRRSVSYDCRRLTWSERNRMTCGSRRELQRCGVRRW